MDFRHNRKGSAVIFIMIFFVSLLSAVSAFINAGKHRAVEGAAEALEQVWVQSVLAEYDINLEKRYGIFGFYGLPGEIEEKIDFYANESFSGKKYIDYGGADCDLCDYSLADSENMKEQMVEAAGFSVPYCTDEGDDTETESGEEGIIRNGGVLYYLPSRGCCQGFSVMEIAENIKNAGNLEDAFSCVSDRCLLQKYAGTFFKMHGNDKGLGKTFFQNEIEYIIEGKPDDSANMSRIRNKIIGIREVLNTAYLEKDEVKRGEIMAAAELLTPGPEAAATFHALAASWALAESVNDYLLLVNGHTVPVMKTPETWAVDLESVINNQEKGCIFTGTDQGESYEDYLNVFLAALDENTLVLRMMDLIQINMRYLYYGDFLLSQYSGGLGLSVEVNGKTYEAEDEY